MGSAIFIGGTEKNADGRHPQVAFTLFSFDLQGIDGLEC
jgi:hypothetical protein